METGEPDIYCAVMAEEHRQQTSSNLGLIFIKGCLTNYNSVSQSEKYWSVSKYILHWKTNI